MRPGRMWLVAALIRVVMSGDECWLCAGKAVLWRLVLVWQFLGGRLWRLGWARSIGGQVTLVPRIERVGEPQDEQNLMRVC